MIKLIQTGREKKFNNTTHIKNKKKTFIFNPEALYSIVFRLKIWNYLERIKEIMFI